MYSPERSPHETQRQTDEFSEKPSYVEQIEAQPRFLRVCDVLSTVQSEFQSEPDETKRLEQWQRFNALFLYDGIYSRVVKGISEEETNHLLTIELDLLNQVKSSVYFGQFNSHDFARQLSEVDNGSLAKIFLSEVQENESIDSIENDEGQAISIEYRYEGPHKIMELHIKESNHENPMSYLAIIKNELQSIYEMLLQDVAKADIVQMESWLLSSNLDHMLKRILGAELLTHRSIIKLDQTFPLNNSENLSDYDEKLLSICSMAVSYNTKVAQRWTKDGVLPEIGRIECTTEDFVEAFEPENILAA